MWGGDSWRKRDVSVHACVVCMYTYVYMSVCVQLLSCVWLCDPMNLSLSGSSLHGILQAGIMEWAAISFSRGSSWPRDWTCLSYTGRWILHHCITWEALYICIRRALYICIHTKFIKEVRRTPGSPKNPRVQIPQLLNAYHVSYRVSQQITRSTS